MCRLALSLALLLAACGPVLPPDAAAPGPAATPWDIARMACERRGGTLAPGPGPGSLVCTIPARDAGRTCARSTDCAGECLARSRTCAPVTPLRGCHDVLDSRGRSTRLCLD